MLNRDLAALVFRVLAIWIISTGVAQALDLLLTWESTGQAMAQVTAGDARAAWESPANYLRLALSALIGRVGFGIGLWFLANRLARLAFPESAVRAVDFGTRATLVRGCTVFIGLWLLAHALPDLGYLLMYFAKGWRPEDAEGYGRVVEPTVRLVFGAALLRGHWVLGLVEEADRDGPGDRDTGA